MKDLEGRTVLLTGASGGIGAVTAALLLDHGAHVIAHYGRDRDAAAAAVSGAPADRSTLIGADLTQPGAGRRLWREAVATVEHIDVLVVNAATMPTTALDGSDGDWDDGWERALRVNVTEPAGLMREAVGAFVAQGGGTIVTLSSWAAQRGSAIPQLGAYAASKAAIHSLTQTIARNYARDGVLGHVVAPGIVHTPLSEISAQHRGGIDAVNASLALGRMAQPAEVAELIAFLATGRCASLTGATLDVNGASNIR
jgi:NAD(P)-dependent dehydrogenase (short-subunit alcohol dehydrogenase family)